MRLGRISTPAGPRFVRADAGGGFIPVDDPFTAFAAGRPVQDADGAVPGELLAPCEPTVVVGIAQNGPGHVAPVQAWLKSPRTVVGPDSIVTLRRDAGTTVAEAEVAVVIGRETTGLTIENAHEYVLGITAVNDLSSPDRSVVDPRNFEAKSGRGYTPLGPWIDTAIGLDDDVALRLLVDGQPMAETSAGRYPISPRECLAYATGWTTLGAGDVIMLGAPFSASPIRPGVAVEVVVADLRLRVWTA